MGDTIKHKSLLVNFLKLLFNEKKSPARMHLTYADLRFQRIRILPPHSHFR